MAYWCLLYLISWESPKLSENYWFDCNSFIFLFFYFFREEFQVPIKCNLHIWLENMADSIFYRFFPLSAWRIKIIQLACRRKKAYEIFIAMAIFTKFEKSSSEVHSNGFHFIPNVYGTMKTPGKHFFLLPNFQPSHYLFRRW